MENSLDQAEEYNKIANNFYKEKNYTEAINYYTKAINMSKESTLPNENVSKYYCNRSNSFLCLDKYDEAINDANISINLNENYKSYYRKGSALKKMKFYQEAKMSFSKAYNLIPNEEYELKLLLANEVKECIMITNTYYLLFQYSNNKTDHFGRLLGIFDNPEAANNFFEKATYEFFGASSNKPEITTHKNIKVVKTKQNNITKEDAKWTVFSIEEFSGSVLKEILIMVNIVYEFPFTFERDRHPTEFKILELDNCINSEISEVVQFNLKESELVKGRKSFFVKLNKYYDIEM